MAAITAQMVNELRSRTGLGMMKCKELLSAAGGDVSKAIDEARKQGVKASIRERVASEGRVVGFALPNGSSAALVEINTNTDFTAKSEPILALANKAAQLLAADPHVDVQKAIEADLTRAAQNTGENVTLGKTAVLSEPNGKVGLYLYGITGKIGVTMAFSGNLANLNEELLTDLGGHIAFARPLALDRGGLPQDIVAKEREIAVEQAKATGKPQNIAEKIAEGKLNAFFKEQTLLDQDFFNAQKFKGTISQLLQQKGLKLQKFARIEVGQ